MKQGHKYNIVNFLVSTYLLSLFICISSFFFSSPFKVGIKITDTPLYDLSLTMSYKLCFINLTIVLLFFISAFLIFSVILITNLLKEKFAFLFLSPFILVCAYVIRKKLLLLQSTPLSLIICFYFLIAILLFLTIFSNIRKTRKRAVIIFSVLSFVCLILLLILLNNLEKLGVFPLVTMDATFALIILIFFGITSFLFFYFFNSLLLFIMANATTKTKRRLSLLYKCFVSLIAIQITIGAFFYIWEYSQPIFEYRREMSKQKLSKSKKYVNVILILIDALKSDHLGCYGYKRYGVTTSPFIDMFAKQGTLFLNCYSQSAWTKSSTTSLLTSLYPTTHGAILHGYKMSEELTIIPEVLQKEGYVTYGFTANPHLKRIFNFDQGFDFFDDYLMQDKVSLSALRNIPIFKGMITSLARKSFGYTDRDNARMANRRILPWIEKYKDQNFFMYLHYMDPHNPYAPPRPYNAMYPYIRGDSRSRAIALYDGEISFVDFYIQDLIKKLKSLGIYDKTMIILTSDHGEGFAEHGHWYHGYSIYQEQIRVPLIIKYPYGIPEPKIVQAPVRLIDVMPTIFDFLGITENVPDMEGESLLGLLEESQMRDVYVDNNLINKNIFKGLIENNEWKYIFTEASEIRYIPDFGDEELYNLKLDPRETRNLIELKPEIAKSMRKKLIRYLDYCKKKAVSSSEVSLDYETVQQLKALGYL